MVGSKSSGGMGAFKKFLSEFCWYVWIFFSFDVGSKTISIVGDLLMYSILY